MTVSLILLHLAAAVCLLLWGTRMVRLGFTRAYGTSLQKIIASGTTNRLSAFFSGALVTAFLQSSTATALLLVSFARRNLITLSASLAVMIGADLSTTLVAQVLSFNLSWLSPLLLIIGIIAHMLHEHGGRKRHLSRILIGLGLMLLALSLIRQAAMPLQHSPMLPLLLGKLQGDPALAILLAALITWLFHSSLASVLLFSSLAASQIIDIELGVLLVLGANIGGGLVPFVVTYKDGPKAKRITFGNILMRLATMVVSLAFLPLFLDIIHLWSGDAARQIVHFHTAFNILLAVLFLPLVSLVALACKKFFPDDKKRADKSSPLYLDEKALDSPVIALAGAARETLRIAELVEDMLEKTITAFQTSDNAVIKRIRKEDNIVDSLYGAIKLYMTRLSQESLDPKEADRYIQILTFSTNLEHIGDIIDNSLMELADKKIRQRDEFSDEGFSEIKNFHSLVLQNMRMAQAIFMSEDPKLAAHLVAGKETVRVAADETSEQHFKRLSEGHKKSIATSSLHLDIIRDYRRINSYITRVAYAIMENQEKYEGQRKD